VLAHRAVADAGGPQVLGSGAAAKDRVGVYFGAWQRGGETGTASAYGALGEALGALPGRVAESLDARGPCLLVDTACSSALVALDAALSDLKRGRVDWALVGGVNVHSGIDRLTAQLKRGRFLSPTGRCHAFSGKADGYARASGGAVVLLCRADLEGAPPAYAEVAGACTAQNRAQRPLSAVDGDAQERVVRGALMDAGALPTSVGAVEAHGTGTPLGDPVEAAALQRIVRAGTVVSAAKARFGHLEAGAGAVGLVAASLYAHRGAVARRAIDGGAVSAAVLRAAPGLDFPGADPSLVPLATDALVGVSSFGFAGSVAHAVLRRAPSNGRALDAAYDAVEEVIVAAPVVVEAPVATRPTSASWDGRAVGDAAPDILAAVWAALARVGATPDEKGAAADVFDLGVDSLGLAEVVGALEAAYGDDCVSVDEVFENSTIAAIAAMVARGATTKGSASSHIFAVDKAPPPPAVVKQVKVAPVEREAIVNRPTSATWFAATHVGSLPREPGASIMDVVGKQVACGINLVNDGEYGRENYVSELLSRIDGCDGVAKGCCDLPCAADMAEVPTYASRFTGGNGLITLNPKRPAKGGSVCYALPTYVDNGGDLGLPALIDAAAAHGLDASSVFVSVPSPGTIACFVEDRHFATQAVGGFAGSFDAKAHKAYVNALAAAVAPEYAKIVASGVRLQVDCPDIAMGCHTKWSALSDEQFVRDVCRVNVEALNSALKTAGASYDTTRVHVCWGNYAGPHHRDIPMAKLWDAIQQLDASTLLLEAANPRHAWELDELLVEKPVSSTTVMAPGCIDSKIPAIEHPEKIARQLLKIAEQVGAWRVQACTDCGFASTARSAAVPAAIAWLKLEALGAGAKLARERVANANAVCRSPLKLAAVGFRVCIIGEASSVLVAALTRACWPWPLRVENDVPQAVATHAHALDWPLAVFGAHASEAASLLNRESGARRVVQAFAFDGSDADAFASHVSKAMTAPQTFDKTSLAGRRCAPPAEVDVVVVGAGVCGLIAARAAQKRGLTVAVLERRNVVGGIWSSVANSSSQVNSSEGGYRLADLVDGDAPHKANRDHSPTSEVLSDIGKLADALGDQVYCGVAVAKILPSGTGSIVVATINGKAQTIQAKGVVVACNDRVGAPRQVQYEGQSTFKENGGLVARGIGDDLSTYDFRGKRVVIVGFGAFAVENVRTALEHGAAHVTVVARRQGAVCPKIIDYLNFVKPFDSEFAHDTTTNVKQMRQWQKLYQASGAKIPDTWPGKIKPDGHTISVSDVWWVAHHLGMLETVVPATIQQLSPGLCTLSTGQVVECDCIIACVGFERNTTVCEALTDKTTISHANYLAPNLIYLADAEIDDGAFNYFFGSSVIEYAKFYSEVFAFAVCHPGLCDAELWGANVKQSPLHDRKWTQYIGAARTLIKEHADVRAIANHQVDSRMVHFWGSYPPSDWVAMNKIEWSELHHRLAGREVSESEQLPYFFDAAPAWCGSDPRLARE
jgi:5-methyltetrahydropteroyltriglutamate--homocysteine methyltransferase